MFTLDENHSFIQRYSLGWAERLAVLQGPHSKVALWEQRTDAVAHTGLVQHALPVQRIELEAHSKVDPQEGHIGCVELEQMEELAQRHD